MTQLSLVLSDRRVYRGRTSVDRVGVNPPQNGVAFRRWRRREGRGRRGIGRRGCRCCWNSSGRGRGRGRSAGWRGCRH